MKKNEMRILLIVNEVSNKVKSNELVEFKILSMRDLYVAEEFFQEKWSKKTPAEQMEVLILLDSRASARDIEHEIAHLSEDQKIILAMLLILRTKNEDYLPQ